MATNDEIEIGDLVRRKEEIFDGSIYNPDLSREVLLVVDIRLCPDSEKFKGDDDPWNISLGRCAVCRERFLMNLHPQPVGAKQDHQGKWCMSAFRILQKVNA